MRYLLTVMARSPLAISAHRTVVGQATETLSYIPGTALRGALAGDLLRQGIDPKSDLFRGLFISPGVRYGNLYPVSGDSERSLPLPATARSCKLTSGFLHDAEGWPSAEHGVIDRLVAQVKGCAGEEKYTKCRKATCGGILDPFRGFYGEDGERFWGIEPRRRLVARTAINSFFGVARHGSLYTIEVLEEGQTFSGYLEVGEDSADKLRQLLRGGRILRMGVARSRGLGEVEVLTCEPRGSYLGLKEMEERLAVLSAAWSMAWLPERMAFAITLYSDAIVLDDYMRYQTAITPEVLQHYSRYWPPLGEVKWPADLKLERAFTRTRRVSGWNPAHGLPKWDDLAIAMGSVFVLTAPKEEEAKVIEMLRKLEEEGVGERREEGFGRLLVGHPFHLLWEEFV